MMTLLASAALFMLQAAAPANDQYQPPEGDEFEMQDLETTDEIVTEEEYVLDKMNYKVPPENIESTPLIMQEDLRFASEFDLLRALSAVNEGLDKCISLRSDLEGMIGDQAGSYNVHPDWGRAYTSCVLQRDEDLKTVGKAIDRKRRAIIAAGRDEGATTLNGMIDRLAARQSELKLAINAEKRTMRSFIRYYNTGVKEY